MSNAPSSIAALLQELADAQAELEHALMPLTADQTTEVHDAVGWTIKDHLDHLAVWEESIASLLERQPRPERLAAMGLDVETVHTLSEDEMNARIRERTARPTLAETRSALRSAHEHLRNVLQRLTDADLQRSVADYQPDAQGATSEQPIIGGISGSSYAHYREHLPWIKAIAEARQS